MKRALVALLVLSGCASDQCIPKLVPAPPVKVPIPTLCIDPAQIPAKPSEVTLPGDPQQAAPLAAAQALSYRSWGEQLAALVSGCVK